MDAGARCLGAAALSGVFANNARLDHGTWLIYDNVLAILFCVMTIVYFLAWMFKD